MNRIDPPLLLIRIACAAAFLYHGSGILFGAFGGPGPVKMAAVMHAPVMIAYLVGIGEFFGGLGILVGLFTRVAAAGVAVIMLGAIFLVHFPHGFDISSGAYEYAFTMFMIALALMLTGPGEYSLSSRLSGSLRRF